MSENGSRNKDSVPEAPSPFTVKVSNRFVVLSLVSCILLAFAVGRTARVLLIINPQKEFLKQQALLASTNTMSIDDHPSHMKLPTPILKEGKEVPRTTYSSKNFDTARSASINSRWVVTEVGQEQCVDQPADGDCKPANVSGVVADNESEHFPEGEHLLIDIANVDSKFLNSEERLANAMLDLVNECGLTLLSYHCHSLKPMGVSCAGVLLESHVSFHTWPTEGVITLDLFTCGESRLLPVVPIAEKLFAVPSETIQEEPKMMWAHKYRGFGDDQEDHIAELTDFHTFPVGVMTDYKQEIATAQTNFQRIDVYDVLRPQFQSWEDYQKSLANDGSYESLHPELFAPDRIVFLDGVLQSRRSGDAAYHEALVHPALFAHENPKRVAIIGGGEGATLREVLKHKTVEKLVMVEIDEKMVKLSKEYLPDWSDCSDILGVPADCFQDPRVELYLEDAFAWFIDRFANGVAEEDPFDVIIMDALDPQVQKDFVEALYNGGPFLGALPNALSENGIFVGQVGQAPQLNDPLEDHSLHRNRVKFIQTFSDLGFESIVDYEEARCGFDLPWQFVVAFKSFDSRADWFVSEAEVNLKIRRRSIKTVQGESPFGSFDGATMLTYLYPSKASEAVFCRGKSGPKLCEHGFDPERRNLPLSETLEVKFGGPDEGAGRGVFAKQDIPIQSYAGLDTLINSVYIPPSTYATMVAMESHEIANQWAAESLEGYSHTYGHVFKSHGRLDIMVDTTLHCFINHGCDTSSNVGHVLNVTEAIADLGNVSPELLFLYSGKGHIYNPFAERQVHYFSSATPMHVIKAGEELFDNYLGMTDKSHVECFA